MATDPPRLRVQKAITAALDTITVLNGYKTDLDGKNFRGRVIFGADDPLPMTSLLEVPIPLDQIPSRADNVDTTGGWELLIQGFVLDDNVNPTDPAHVLMADVKQMLAREKKRDKGYDIFGLGTIVTEMQIGTGVVRPPDDISSKAYFWLTLTLKLAETLDAPYAD